MLTVELVHRGAARHARRTAVVCGDKSLTFGEVDAAANKTAHVLAGLGVARGGRVGLLIGNGIWSIPVDFGCVKAGAARVRIRCLPHLRQQVQRVNLRCRPAPMTRFL